MTDCLAPARTLMEVPVANLTATLPEWGTLHGKGKLASSVYSAEELCDCGELGVRWLKGKPPEESASVGFLSRPCMRIT